MDLFKNKQVLIGLGAGVVLLLAVFAYFTFFSGGGDDSSGGTDTASTPTPASRTSPSGYTGPTGPTSPGMMPGGPGAMPGGPGGAQLASAGTSSTEKPSPPAEAHRSDPFAPLIKVKKPSPQELLAMEAEQQVASLPPLTVYGAPAESQTAAGTATAITAAQSEQEDTSQRRVAGIITGKNAYAILEIDGQTAVVKPGDVLPDLTRVERIEPDRVLLKKGDRNIFVPLASSDQVNGGGGGAPGRPQAGPYGYPGGGRPRGIPPPPVYGGRRGG